jgi:hypothetical protein
MEAAFDMEAVFLRNVGTTYQSHESKDHTMNLYRLENLNCYVRLYYSEIYKS